MQISIYLNCIARAFCMVILQVPKYLFIYLMLDILKVKKGEC